MDNEYPSDVENDEITYSPNNSRKIGQFHTLCVGVPANTTGLVQEYTGISVGTTVTICGYFKNQDLDFVNFYTKTIDAVNDGNAYTAATVLHPLQGFNTGDILPESVWCLSFHPSSKSWDGMVYCNAINKAVDIYLQSGEGSNTRSEYGSPIKHASTSVTIQNYMMDSASVGKYLINYDEFVQISMGSNQQTVAGDYTELAGGHVDTAGRRMISFIGCEDCCGYFWQQCRNVSSFKQTNSSSICDGRGLFGQVDDMAGTLLFGGAHVNNANFCGSKSADGYTLFYQPGAGGGNTASRSICDISIV